MSNTRYQAGRREKTAARDGHATHLKSVPVHAIGAKVGHRTHVLKSQRDVDSRKE